MAAIGQTDDERDPLLRKSRMSGRRLMFGSTMRYHAVHNDFRWYLCGCAPSIRGITRSSALRRNARRDRKWAGR